jgi:hypothetical protein
MNKPVSFSFTAVVLGFALAGTAAQAQTSCNNAGAASATCNVAATVSSTVQHVVSMDIGSASLTLTDVTGISQYNSGTGIATVDDLSKHTLTIRANRAYKINIKANASNFTHTPAGGASAYSKPAGDLSWSTNGTTFTALTTSDAQMNTGSPTNSATVQMSYRTTYGITTDAPGGYSLGVTFTVVAP